MYMKGGEAQIQINPWSSSGGRKSVLQQAWFRVSKIPDDQRGLITLAKVGGLVGKVMEIDESTRLRVDYVRLKIACKDVTKVPKTAEGVLGLDVYDFGFEREVPIEEIEKNLKIGTKVSNDQPPNKKQKSDTVFNNLKPASFNNTGTSSKTPQGKAQGKQVASAPPKLDTQPGHGGSKFMKDAQKTYYQQYDNDEEKVYIPENIEELDSESDSFGERIRKLSDGQFSKNKEDSENQADGDKQV
jgi:hypothetical protein